MTTWTRADLPDAQFAYEIYLSTADGHEFAAILDAVVAHLNDHHPKPDGGVPAAPAPRVVVTAAELDALPVDTVVVDQSGIPRMKRYPSSHMPGGWTHGGRDPLSARMLADGHPMTVAWLPVDRAERAERERDEAVARAEQAERDRDVWEALTPLPAVTRDDVKGGIDHWIEQGGNHEALLDDLWRWVSGDDPAVYVVRESDVEAQAALRNRFGEFIVNGTVLNVTTAEDCREKAQRHLDAVARCESIARAIEAEQAEDPVEAKAEELFDATDESIWAWATAPIHTQDRYRRIARHVLGQEADQ